MISTSFGCVCEKFVKVMVALATTPFRPETLMVEGYGNALALSRIAIKVLLVNRYRFVPRVKLNAALE